MRARLVRLAIAVFAVAVGGGSASAMAAGCPGNIVIGGTMACHNVSGSTCSNCRYLCDDGEYYNWNMCET